MEFDGKRQRNALTAAENAIRAIADRKGERALANARRAAEMDQIDAYARFAVAVAGVADEIDGGLSAASWDAIAGSLEPGPLSFLIDELRG